MSHCCTQIELLISFLDDFSLFSSSSYQLFQTLHQIQRPISSVDYEWRCPQWFVQKINIQGTLYSKASQQAHFMGPMDFMPYCYKRVPHCSWTSTRDNRKHNCWQGCSVLQTVTACLYIVHTYDIYSIIYTTTKKKRKNSGSLD